MKLELTKEEQQQLTACIESTIKHASNSLQAAAILLPLASKIQALGDQKEAE